MAAADPSTEPRRIRHFRIALTHNTIELPWTSRAPLLTRLRKHDHGLQVVIAFEAVGATQPVRLNATGKPVLLQVVDAWYSEVTEQELPEGIGELRNELLADDELT